MSADLSKALLNPQLWRLEAARRRRQLEELQGYLQRLEGEYRELERRLLDFQARYEAQLGDGWRLVDALQGELLAALQGLARASGEAPPPSPTPRKADGLPSLPPSPAWPDAPAQESSAAAPTLKELHRRAAMRLHPDRAASDEDRQRREALMRDANLAYADADRATLEALLIAAGESPQRLGGFDVHAHWRWLERCEALAQGRMRVLQAHLVQLRQHRSLLLADAIQAAEGRGMDPLAIMQRRLAEQARELQQQIYIGARLQPRSELARAFLGQWQQRWAEKPSLHPLPTR
jgi:uncharacterized protein YciI